MADIKLNGLRSVIRKFEKTEDSAKSKNWQLEVGSCKAYWTLSYHYIPVMTCVKNRLMNDGIDRDDFLKVCDIVIKESTPATAA